MPKGWFGPKLTGYGISPRSWEGWLATAVFVAGLFVLMRVAAPDLAPLLSLTPGILALILCTIWLFLFLALVGSTYSDDV